jgi:hypothetical protein
MPANPIGAVINGIANIGSSLIQNRGAKKAQERARAHDINMWDKTNAYNDPKSQMERLRNAGLNPNMVYGGSSGQTAGTANSLPAAKAPDYQMDLGQPAMDYVTMKNTEAQTENTRSQQGLNDANTILTNAKTETELQDKKLKGVLTSKESQMLTNLEEINNGLIQDTLYKTNKATLSSQGRIGNENVLEQEWNKLRLENPNATTQELLKKIRPELLQILFDMSPLKDILHGPSWEKNPDIKY